MKWIKASERLPEARKTYFVKTTRGKSVLSTNYYDAKRRKIVFIRINPDSSHTIVDNVIEWLDESEPQPQMEQEGQEELWEEVKRIILSGTENWHILKQSFTIKRKQ